MIKKEQLRSLWNLVRPISYWYILVLFIVSLVVSIYALRQNNLTMIRLREQVAQADKDNGDVETALRKLREFVYAHMNTDLATNNQVKPPIQLKYRYERLVVAEQARVAAENAKIYTEAQNYCEALYPQSFSGGPRVPCVQDYVASHGVKAQPIPDSLYKFDFISPRWSPDLAGLGLVASAFFFVLFVVKYSLERYNRSKLKHLS